MAKYPKIAAELDADRSGVGAHELAPTTAQFVWWTCPAGHSYDMRVANRTAGGQNCPICSRKRITADNGLAALYPHLLAEWHPEKNAGIDVRTVPADSPTTTYWWRCGTDPAHEWQATSQHRASRGFGCPYCSGQIITDANRLSTCAPAVAAELDEAASGVRAHELHVCSNKSVWWQCTESPEHRWRATIASRRRGDGCPFCSGKRAWSGRNLATDHPTVAAELDPDLNGGLHPEDLTPASGKQVTWRCSADPAHTWTAKVASRTRGNATGCPHCTKGRRTSIREIALRRCLALAFPDAHEGIVPELGRRKNVDVLIPSRRLIVEYDGGYFHRNAVARDRAKNADAHAHGWTVLRVREAPLGKLDALDVLSSNREPITDVVARVLDSLRTIHPDTPVLPPAALAAEAKTAEVEYRALQALGAHRRAASTRAAS